MRFRITPILWAALLPAMLFSDGCASGKIETNPQISSNWNPVRVDAIPNLNAVEVPLDDQMVSNSLLKEINAKQRIKLTPEVVTAFESNNTYGLLNPDNQFKLTTARQFSAYCTAENKIVLIYNLLFIGYKPCNYLSDRWEKELVGGEECSDIGVFDSQISCYPAQ